MAGQEQNFLILVSLCCTSEKPVPTCFHFLFFPLLLLLPLLARMTLDVCLCSLGFVYFLIFWEARQVACFLALLLPPPPTLKSIG